MQHQNLISCNECLSLKTLDSFPLIKGKLRSATPACRPCFNALRRARYWDRQLLSHNKNLERANARTIRDLPPGRFKTAFAPTGAILESTTLEIKPTEVVLHDGCREFKVPYDIAAVARRLANLNILVLPSGSMVSPSRGQS